MRFKPKLSLLVVGSLAVALVGVQPAWSQPLSQGLSQGQQPSEQQIEAFCANWGQLTESEKRQYRDQYERYCRDGPVFGRPVGPQPQKPAAPEKSEQPERPAEPEPQLRPVKPEPVIPEPALPRVDLVGELALAGSLAREPGERQRLRVTVENRGSDAPAGNQLWARVFLSDREVSRRGASAGAFAFSGARRGHPLRLPGAPGPDQSREVSTEITLPAGAPDGNYWWCVRLDTRQQVAETDEGNNVACARKVVALGGESESELSDVFGSKVAALNERRREGAQTASQPSHPGLLRQSELDRLAAMLMETGGTDYTLFTGQNGGDLSAAQKRGLLLMRDRGDLTPLGGEYYADGRGNMVLFGELPGSTGDGAPYALTLFSGGGLDLVVDTDRDGVVDIGVSEGLKDRFGFLARPGLEHILDCMKQMVQGGTGAAESLPECLGRGSSDDDDSGGGGSGGGGGLGSHLDDVLEPQCDPESGIGSPVGFSEPASDDSKPFDEQLRDAADNHRNNAEHHRDAAERASEAGNEDLADRHRSGAREEQRLAQKADQAAADYEFVRKVAGDESSSDEDLINAMKIAADSAQAYRKARDNRSPAPGPGGTPPAGGSDPRCQEPSTWNRLATEECANDMAHCINKLTDTLYGATGGQCRTVRGLTDNTTIECEGNDSFGECIEGSDDVRGCAEKHAGGDNGGVTPSPNDDMTRDDQGTLEYGLMDVHPFGATLAAMCRSGGGIGPCGDPSPAMDAAR